jgi:pimeloyl-ACP methyl ester carboxylesterase
VSERLDVPVTGGSLAVFRLGDTGTAPAPVIAVHGVTANSRAWRAVARALTPDVSLLAVDLRGRGASASLPGPYGMAAHAQDILAVLDHLGLERAVLAGHSLGAYIACRLAAERPERIASLILADGGLSAPLPPEVDRQALIAAGLGPALARLRLTFESLDAYVEWWRGHPAFAGGQVADEDLRAYAAHDLVGEPPQLRSGVSEAAVRADAEDALDTGLAADRLSVPATLLRAPRGLLNEDTPFQPAELARRWAEGAPHQRRILDVPDLNHYTLVMGERGAQAVAGAIRAAFRESARTGSS